MSISAVIPAYNAEASIAAAIRSVLSQTRPPEEVIVIDDGSEDGTAGIVKSFGPAVTLMRQANAGPSEARNAGVRAARGDWLAFLDADDLWLPGKLERQWPETADPRVAIVVCRAQSKSGASLGRRLGFEDLWARNEVILSSALVRRSAFETVGGFWRGRICEDYHLWLLLAAAGWEIANCPEDLALYKPSTTSLSRQGERFVADEIACLADVASRCGISAARLRRRLAASYLAYGRGAIHDRNLPFARRLLLRSLRHRVSTGQIVALAAACLPRTLLDLRRAALGVGESAAR